jgi:hypothetical protein
VTVFFLSVYNGILPKLDVWLTFGSLLKFSMGLNIGWEVCGEFGGPGVRRDRVADKTAMWPYLF